MEKILSIKDEGFTLTDNSYDGYTIVTDKQTIYIGISNRECCCENWGYLTTNDTVDEFVGANLTGISLTDSTLSNTVIAEEVGYLDQGDSMFVNLSTSKGLLQLVVYNAHNGYYGHGAVVVSKQLSHYQVC